MRRTIVQKRWTALLLAFALSFGAWMLIASSRSAAGPTSTARPDAARSSGKNIGPRIKPRVVQAKLDHLNQKYDDCMTSHGAAHVDLAGGAWTYQDDEAAAGACEKDLDAIEAYADSAEYHASDAMTHKLLKQFWDCVGSLTTQTDAAVQACADRASYPD
jgi:hypothetical protein